MSAHFSLDMLERVTKEFQMPRGPFRPEGSWENRYTLYCLVHNNRKNPVYGNPAGSLIVRRMEESGRRKLGIDYRKTMNKGLAHRISGEVGISPDALATPEWWTVAAEFAAVDGAARAWPRIEHRMQSRGGKLELSAGGLKRSVPRPTAFTHAWSLVEAVQRLLRRPGNTLRFTFFDRNNVAKPGHILRYRESAEVELGNTTVRLHGFEHLGDGFVPSVYWTDEAGRLVMFNHSLQGYILQSGAKEAPGV
jgi:hypothetical protein